MLVSVKIIGNFFSPMKTVRVDFTAFWYRFIFIPEIKDTLKYLLRFSSYQ